MLTVAVLGEVEVRRDGGAVDLPAGLTRDLLVRLAVDAGRYVRAETLLEDLWGEPTGRNTLQSKVSQLRRALGDREVVAAGYDGYALLVPPAALDVTRAAELASLSASARAAGDPAGSLTHATEALSWFRGEVLPGAADWAVAHRTRLEEVRLGLLEDALAARVELGGGGELVGDLEALVAEHPWREGFWVSLVLALYRSGRQADALAAYARVRTILRDDLGVEPGEALRSLEGRVLAQDATLGSRRPSVAPPGNLPAAGAPLVGRDEDLATASQLLLGSRLVTVTGSAGVGKTRLAVEVARATSYPGGAWLVRLDAVDASADLAQVVAEELHVPGGSAGLLERLTGATTLLVLDNCEHLVEAAADLVRGLLDRVPSVVVLATSQVSLGLDEERLHVLEPLDAAASAELFARRARELRSRFAIDADTAADVGRVCAALDGLPLAIELAAARVRSMSVQDIARRLDDRFSLLSDPTSRRPLRQRTLAGAIGWSYDLLFPDDQRGLWALSVFAGGATLDALEHVLVALDVPVGAVLDTVGRLVDRSLVTLDPVSGGARYRLLDSIRTFAAGRLTEAGLAEAATRAHAAWYADRAAWCDAHVRGPEQPGCLAFARAERADVDAALGWAAAHDPATAARIAVGLGWTWVVLGDGTAGAARIRSALGDGVSPRLQAEALLLAGWLEASAGDVGLAQADLEAAETLVAQEGDGVLRADLDRHRAFLAIQQGRPDLVLVHARAAREVTEPRGLVWRTAGSLLLGAYGSLMLGDVVAADRDATAALDLVRPLGDSWAMVHGEAMLGGIAQAEHRFADAARALARAADESAAQGFPGQAALHRASLGRVQQRVGDPAAGATYARAIDEAVAGGDGRLAATARLHLARLLRAGGDDEAALGLLEQNARWFGEAGGGDFALLTDCTLAAVRDDEVTLTKVLAAARDGGHVEVQVFALDALARLAASTDRTAAADLLSEADALAPGVAHVVDEADRYDAAVARLQLR